MPVRDTSPPGVRLVVVALCLMVCAVPLVYLPGIYEYALIPKLLALHLCIALTCLGWLVQTRWGRNVRLISSPLFLPALCLMGVALLSSPGTTHPLDTFVGLINQAALIVLFFVVANVLSLQCLRPILWTSVATGLVVALVGILQYHGLAFVSIPSGGPPSATFGNRNFAAMYLVCAIPLGGLLFLTARCRAGLSLSGLSAALMGVYLVYTRTRSAWVGIAGALLGVGVLMAFWPGVRRPILEAVRSGMEKEGPETGDREYRLPSSVSRPFGGKGTLALGFLILFVVLSGLPPYRSILPETKADIVSTATSVFRKDVTKEISINYRFAAWGATLRMVADHPLLGVGPGGWVRAYPPYDRGATTTVSTFMNNPHNDYLWIASEYGLIGLGIYIWFLVTGFRCLLMMTRSPESLPRIAALMFTLSLLSTVGDAFFNFPREQPQAAMFPYLLFGVAASAAKDERDKGPHPPPKGEKRRAKGDLTHPHTPHSPCRSHEVATRHPLSHWEREGVSIAFLMRRGRMRSFAFRLVPCLLLIVSLSAAELSRRRIGFSLHYLRATFYGFREDWKAVLAEARRALEYGTFDPHILVIKGHALDMLNDYSEADAAYRQALVYTPHSWYAHAGLCSVCLQQGRIEDALFHGQATLSILPNHADTHNNLGMALREKGDLDGAVSEYRQAVKINPRLAEAHNNLAVVLTDKGDLDSAVSEYRQAIKINPGLADAHYNLGAVLAVKGDLDGAIHEYRQALRIKPDHVSAHNNLGVVLAAKGDLDGAIHEYRQALRIKPDHASAYYHIGDALTAKGDLDSAVQAFRACIRLTTDEKWKQKAEDSIRKLGGIP